jgi:hypothetical protein
MSPRWVARSARWVAKLASWVAKQMEMGGAYWPRQVSAWVRILTPLKNHKKGDIWNGMDNSLKPASKRNYLTLNNGNDYVEI